jgi:hypothetical protein
LVKEIDWMFNFNAAGLSNTSFLGFNNRSLMVKKDGYFNWVSRVSLLLSLEGLFVLGIFERGW